MPLRKAFLIATLLAATTLAPRLANAEPAVESKFATVNGVKLHYLIAGKGSPVLLLHGFAETSHMWLPLIAKLAPTHTVIAPDLRGYGDSEKPPTGYGKKAMAMDIHALMDSLGDRRIELVGHDIGLMVAYAYAAQYPDEVERIVLMDAFLPGVGDWRTVWLLRDLWHFHFYGKTPLQLVAAASASTWSTSGTISRPIPTTRFPRPIASSMPRPTHNPAPCRRASKPSMPSSRTPRTSRRSPPPSSRCRCSC